MKIIIPATTLIVFLTMFFISYAINFSCDPCEVNDCQCSITGCDIGMLDIYDSNCTGFPAYILTLSNGKMTWKPTFAGTYYLRVLCDDNNISNCTPLNVNEQPKVSSAPDFVVFDFWCDSILYGYKCNINYTNDLGENAIVVMLYADENGKVVSMPVSIVSEKHGLTSSILYSTSFPPGLYRVSWKVYKESDMALSTPVKWSKSTYIKEITW